MSFHRVFLERFSKFSSSYARRGSSGFSLLFLMGFSSFATTAYSETVQLTPVKDNTIYSERSNSNGSGASLFAGTIRLGDNRRALMAFNIGSAVPAGATIDSVSLRMSILQSSQGSGSPSSTLHRLRSDWGEAGSSGSGQGGPAQTGDATWTRAFFNTVSWSAGGDFVTQASATSNAGSGSVTWSSEGLIADVQSWLDGEQENFGWILIVTETGGGSNRTAKRFGSRESGTASNRPTLTIEYTLAKSDQTIAFDAIPDQVLSSGSLVLVATATSELPVSFSVVSGPATVEGNVLTFTGVGSVTVRASQAGDANFNPAPDVDQTFDILKSDQTITFNPIPNQVFERGTFTLGATATSGLDVTFSIVSGPATLEGNVVMFTDVGSITVRASQSGDDTFNAAPDVEQTFEVNGALDTWLMANFTEAELLDPNISGGGADPDLDRLVNDTEYALGLNPRVPSSLFTSESALSINEAGDSLVLRFSRNPEAFDVTITIEETFGLENWISVATSVNGAAFQPTQQGYMVTETSGDGVLNVELISPFTFPAGSFQRINVVR